MVITVLVRRMIWGSSVFLSVSRKQRESQCLSLGVSSSHLCRCKTQAGQFWSRWICSIKWLRQVGSEAWCSLLMDPASLGSATLGRGYFLALIQVDLVSIFFRVSSAHRKKKAQCWARQGRRVRALIPFCTVPAWYQWNYTPIKPMQHKPESWICSKVCSDHVYCVFAKTL